MDNFSSWLYVIFIYLLMNVIPANVFAQDFFLYGTHTLAEAGTNPATQVFEGPKCKSVEFNFFIPQVQGNMKIYGPAGKFITDANFYNRLNAGEYGAGRSLLNYATGSFNLHYLSLKVLLNRVWHKELYIDYQTRGMASGNLQNKVFSLALASKNQANPTYYDYLNTNTTGMMFNQISVGIRRDLDDEGSSFGFTAGLLSGIAGARFYVGNSSLKVARDSANILINGNLRSNLPPNQNNPITLFNKVGDYLPNFRNPGLSLNFGYNNATPEDGSSFSINLKDIGFIWWRQAWQTNLKPTDVISPLDSFTLKQQINRRFKTFFQTSSKNAWVSPLNSRIEGSYTRNFFSFLRTTFVLSKTVLDAETYVDVLNDLHSGNLHLITNTGYDSYNSLDFGMHFLYRSGKVEAFIGSQRLAPSIRVINELSTSSVQNGRVAGSIDFGFALKFGECFLPQTATDMYLDDHPGFFKRLFRRYPEPFTPK